MLTLAVLFIAALGSYWSPVFAQTDSNITKGSTNLTATIESEFGFNVGVLYESPSTIILSGKTVYGNDLWHAVDLVKQFGYKIDAVTQVTEESEVIAKTRYLTPVYTIFLSK